MEEKGVYLKSLKIMHMALLAGQCLMLALITFLVFQKKVPATGSALDKTLQVFALLAALAGVFGARRMFKSKLSIINNTSLNIQEKALQYRSASLIRWAVTEFAVLFIIICFFVTGNYAFAALAIFLMVFFALQAPTRLTIMLHLQLNEQEADELQ